MGRFSLSEIQAKGILEMRLQRLVGLERQKVEDEYESVMVEITKLEAILGSEQLLMNVVKQEMIEVRDAHSNERRTEIIDSRSELDIRDLIAEEEQVVTLSVNGYIKRSSMTHYQEQRRGGHGKRGMRTREEDSVRDIFIANTHTTMLVFTTHGWVYGLPVYEIPEVNRDAKGRPLVNLVRVEPDDEIASVVSIWDFDETQDLLCVSRNGLIKRTRLSEFKNLRSNGLRSYDCAEGDELFEVCLTRPEQQVLIATAGGKAIRFRGSDVRHMGRIARGMRGIDLRDNDGNIQDKIVSVELLEDDPGMLLLTVTEKGYGKRTPVSEYRLQGRGGKGVINIRTGDRNGQVVGSVQVHVDDKVMMITDTGRVIKTRVSEVRETGRAALGVTLMRVADDEKIVSVARVVEDEDDDDEGLAEE